MCKDFDTQAVPAFKSAGPLDLAADKRAAPQPADAMTGDGVSGGAVPPDWAGTATRPFEGPCGTRFETRLEIGFEAAWPPRNTELTSQSAYEGLASNLRTRQICLIVLMLTPGGAGHARYDRGVKS